MLVEGAFVLWRQEERREDEIRNAPVELLQAVRRRIGDEHLRVQRAAREGPDGRGLLLVWLDGEDQRHEPSGPEHDRDEHQRQHREQHEHGVVEAVVLEHVDGRCRSDSARGHSGRPVLPTAARSAIDCAWRRSCGSSAIRPPTSVAAPPTDAIHPMCARCMVSSLIFLIGKARSALRVPAAASAATRPSSFT